MKIATKKDGNPGAYKEIKPISLYKIAHGIFQRIKKRQWRGAVNYLVANGGNYFNQRKKKKLFYCICCKSELAYFVNLSNKQSISYNSACPMCSSRKRHRGLKLLYLDIVNTYHNPMILHFAPEPVLMKVFEGKKVQYKTTDYFLEDVDYPNEDIQNLSFQASSFNLVLCNHVIEHVADDDSALAEISRILKPDGTLLLSIPGNWHKADTFIFNDLSNNGHYRHYGMDVITKLKLYFNSIEVCDLVKYNNQNGKSMGLNPKQDLVFICKK